MNPGATMQSFASTTSASGAESADPIFAILPLSTSTSSRASVFEDGSITRPFLMSSMWQILPVFLHVRRAGHQLEQYGHAHRQAVRHLLQHTRLRAVGH